MNKNLQFLLYVFVYLISVSMHVKKLRAFIILI